LLSQGGAGAASAAKQMVRDLFTMIHVGCTFLCFFFSPLDSILLLIFWQGLTGAEATAMQQKLGSGADAGKNAVSNEEMEKLKAALKAKDEALGGMKKQMELMGTSQLQEARDEFESEKARALDEMEKRHAEKMGEMSAALQAKDADASSIRNKLEEAEKST
jgi:hypothetical protein